MATRCSISVLAGTNGAGKSSVAGASIRARGGEYFNPDEAARRILEAQPGIGVEAANSRAWLLGKRLLEDAIARRGEFAFETTLGGNTIPELLHRAHSAGLDIRIWYVGLESPELHIARVKSRVARGGHDIPQARIRERYDRSRENLIRLLPILTELWVFDNTEEGDSARGGIADPQLILHVVDGLIAEAAEASQVRDWAKPIFIAVQRQFST
ncbi:MAG TPA: zeta toxin family protein [Longimicrobium sp.]|nr:zeta toxin family protein [Longimicrobium sp.]